MLFNRRSSSSSDGRAFRECDERGDLRGAGVALVGWGRLWCSVGVNSCYRGASTGMWNPIAAATSGGVMDRWYLLMLVATALLKDGLGGCRIQSALKLIILHEVLKLRLDIKV